MKNNNYIALFEHDAVTGKYGVVIPDFPGFSTVGNSFAEALQNATEGLAGHIEVMKDLNQDIPNPSTFEKIKKDWKSWTDWARDTSDYITVIIPAIPEYGTQKILVTMDSRLIARIDRVAKNRSAFLASAAEYMLDDKPAKRVAA